MQLSTDVASDIALPQPIVEETLYHIFALVDWLRGIIVWVVPDSSMKALTIGSLVQA
jgi:hypothetical protein